MLALCPQCHSDNVDVAGMDRCVDATDMMCGTRPALSLYSEEVVLTCLQCGHHWRA